MTRCCWSAPSDESRTAVNTVILLLGGVVAGIVNTVAGGGSTLTVALLVLTGVPGASANASNRIGVLTSNFTAVASFRRQGVGSLRTAWPVLLPAVTGSLVGSFAISRVTDAAFERVFAILMVPLVLLALRKPAVSRDANAWSQRTTIVVFFAIGIYGGAVQAGIGLVLLAALTRAGFDLVEANSIKVLVTLIVTAVALPVFVLSGLIVWVPALTLAIGFSIGGWAGAYVAVAGGERLIRIAMVIAALVLAASMLGLFD